MAGIGGRVATCKESGGGGLPDIEVMFWHLFLSFNLKKVLLVLYDYLNILIISVYMIFFTSGAPIFIWAK